MRVRTEEWRKHQSEAKKFVYLKDDVSYYGYHDRLYKKRGKASKCDKCGASTAKRYEWANLTGNYKDLDDYIQLCTSCHRIMDDKGYHNCFKLKPKKCKMCGEIFQPTNSNHRRCGNKFTKGTCAYKHFIEYQLRRYYGKRTPVLM